IDLAGARVDDDAVAISRLVSIDDVVEPVVEHTCGFARERIAVTRARWTHDAQNVSRRDLAARHLGRPLGLVRAARIGREARAKAVAAAEESVWWLEDAIAIA